MEQLFCKYASLGVDKIDIVLGDITQLHVDAIVNAANKSLMGGGGVDGAIHRTAGPELLEACRALNGCETGEAKISKGFKLPAAYVIHTAGPIWHGGDRGEAELLANCYRNSLALTVDHDIKSIAFPAISCGIYGYPLALACNIAVTETLAFLSDDAAIDKAIFVCFDQQAEQCYQEILMTHKQ